MDSSLRAARLIVERLRYIIYIIPKCQWFAYVY